MRPLLLLALSLPAQAQQIQWGAEQDIWPAIYLDVTPEGFALLEDVARAVLPPTLPIDDMTEGGDVGSGIASLSYAFGVNNLYAGIEIADLTVIPATDEINLALDLRLSVNTPSDPAVLTFDASADVLFGLFSFDVLDEDCAFNLNSTAVPVNGKIHLAIPRFWNPGCEVSPRPPCGEPLLDDDGNIQIDVEFVDINIPVPQVEQEDFNLRSAPGGSCIVDDLLEIADFFGFDVIEDYVMAELEPLIDEQIGTVLDDLEVQAEDIIKQLIIEQQIDALGTTLDVSIYPRDFVVRPEGLRLELAGHFSSGALPHPCVSRFDTGYSLGTIPPADPRYPYIGQTPAGVTPGINVLINDDWLNQATYAIWRAGLLCQEISDGNSPVDLPLPINTTLLGLLAPGVFNDLFPTTAPLVLKTRPEKPPIVSTGGDNDANVLVEELGLDLAAELDGRLTRVAGINLTAEAGLDITFDGASGDLGIAIDFAPEDIGAVVVFNDLKPESSDTIETGFGNVAQQLVGPLLATALGELEFALPAISGLGLTGATIRGAGPMEDFLGLFGTIGPVPYGDGAAGGCDAFDVGGSGCDAGAGGCATPMQGRILPIVVLLALPLLRRRR